MDQHKENYVEETYLRCLEKKRLTQIKNGLPSNGSPRSSRVGSRRISGTGFGVETIGFFGDFGAQLPIISGPPSKVALHVEKETYHNSPDHRYTLGRICDEEITDAVFP